MHEVRQRFGFGIYDGSLYLINRMNETQFHRSIYDLVMSVDVARFMPESSGMSSFFAITSP